MSRFMHLQTEARFWTSYLEPIIKPLNMYWVFDVDYDRDTVVLRMINPVPASMMQAKKLNKDDLISTINVDRQVNSEEKIKRLIDKAIKRLLNLAV